MEIESNGQIPMTAAGYTALETELKHCQQIERPASSSKSATPARTVTFRKMPSITPPRNCNRAQ